MTDRIRKILAVCLREFFALTGSAAAWVFLVIFLVLAGFLTFMVSDILSIGQADLTPFFDWMPWLFLFVVPALAMPLWSEERRSGTLELSLSYPVSVGELVTGKFLAGLALLLCALVFTLGTPLTIAVFGKPDANAIICGYLGALMAGAVFLAASCFCSALTRSQTASFLLSLLLCSILLFTGWERVTGYLETYLPQSVCRWIGQLAVLPHYQAFQRGLIDTSEAAYCILTTLLFLYLTGAALSFSSTGIGGLFLPGAMSDRYTWKHLARLAGGIVTAFYVYFCLIYAAGTAPLRFDATADRAYSLTDQSRALASSLTRAADIRLYLSPANSGMSRELLQYGERVEWLLRDFARASHGKIRLNVIRPEQDSSDEEAALLDGIEPAVKTGTGDRYYLGIAVSSGSKVIPLPKISPARESLLEYELVRAMQNAVRKRRPVIGVISAFPVLGTESNGAGPASRKQAPLYFAQELSKDYDFREIALDAAAVPQDVDALIVYHPSGISTRTLYAIDQYLMRGGKIAVFLDPRLGKVQRKQDGSSLTSLKAELERKQSGLGGLPAAWGVEYDKDSVVSDMKFKFNPSPSEGVLSVQPNLLLITPEGISRTTPLTAALTRLFMIYPGAFPVGNPKPGLTYKVLVHTTRFARLFPKEKTQAEIFTELSGDPNAEREELPLVLDITGKFTTAFPDGAPDASGTDGGQTHRTVSTGSPEVVLFGDSDMLFRDAAAEVRRGADGQMSVIPWNDNITLLLNVMEKLCGGESLAKLRTRMPMSRPLTKIAESRSRVEAEFNDRYSALLRDLQQVRAHASAIRRRHAAAGAETRFTAEERKVFTLLSKKESEFRREEKKIRNSLKEGLDAINSRARLVNIAVIPGAAALLGVLWGILRRVFRRRRSKR